MVKTLVLWQVSHKKKKDKEVMLSGHQVTQELNHGDPTFVASLLEVKENLVSEIPTIISDVLKNFQDFMRPELLVNSLLGGH